MKKLFTILAVAAAVVACQKNETIALDNGEAIAFGNAFVENSVRADYSATDLQGFTLYGTVNNVNIYNGVAVTKGTANYGDAWTCPVQQYWIEGAAYIIKKNKGIFTISICITGCVNKNNTGGGKPHNG